MLSRPCSLPQSPAPARCKGRETRRDLGSQAVDIARLLGDGRHRGATESEFSPCCQGAAEAAASVAVREIENSVSGSGLEGPLLYL